MLATVVGERAETSETAYAWVPPQARKIAMATPSRQNVMQRIDALATHVIGSSEPAAAESAVERRETAAAGDRRLLSADQLADFARTGYCMFTIPEDELPSSHHAEYYDAIYAHAHRSDGGKEPMPIAAVAAVVDSPTFSGALRSILGPGYMVGCYGNGTPILHAPRAKADAPGASASVDQNW